MRIEPFEDLMTRITREFAEGQTDWTWVIDQICEDANAEIAMAELGLLLCVLAHDAMTVNGNTREDRPKLFTS